MLNTLFVNNDRLYSDTSVAVHGGSSMWLSGFQIPASLKFDNDRQKRLERTVRMFSEMSVAFLVAAHMDRFSALGQL